MPSFPTSVFSPTSKSAGQVIQPAHVNDLQDEVVAIESGYINGTAPLNSSNSTVANLSVTGGSTLGSLTLSTSVTISTGTLTINQGQIVFPATQVASASTTVLDDYREGTFTPTIGGSGGESGQVYASQQGFYRKVGSLVFVFGYVELTTRGTLTGSVQLEGLPFTAANTSVRSSIQITWFGLATNWVSIVGLVNNNATTVTLAGATAAANNNETALAQADFDDSCAIRFTGCYIAAN